MIQSQLQELIQKQVGAVYPESANRPLQLEKPANSQFGDYAITIALSLAKQLKQSPMDIANNITQAIFGNEQLMQLIERIEVVSPGFINITIRNSVLVLELNRYMQPTDRHPEVPGEGQTIMVEFSSPNIAKPFNVGHLRSTIIGDCLARIYNYLGYTVLKDNHLGDWGTQYGKLAYAVEQWGDWSLIEKNPIPELFALYVKINEETKKDESLQEAARQYFKRLEEGDPHVRQIWERLSDISKKDFNRLYQKFGVSFDMMLGEAFYEPYLKEVIQECMSKHIASESQGALVINFDDPKIQDPPLMIRKSNGTSTYGTRDLAGVKYRFTKYKLDKLVIEIGVEQQFYFQQIIAASEKLGWVKPGHLVHVGHGHFLASSGKRLSTRKGETVWLDELVIELEEKAKEIVRHKSPDLPDNQKNLIAEQVAIGALKYNDLSQNRMSNIIFDKDKALSLEGNSAPYLQYTIARANSVLRQSTQHHSPVSENFSEIERSLLVSIIQFDYIVGQVAADYLPNHLTNYLFQTAQKFNTFYQSEPILKAEESDQQRRLALTKATVNVLTTGLSLLGVSVPERM